MEWKGTDLVQAETCANLNDAMKVSKEDRHGKEEDVNRVADKMAQQLQYLADAHPQRQDAEG